MKNNMKAKAPKASPKQQTPPRMLPTHEEIAAEAEVLWRQRGCPEGMDIPIWHEAERQLQFISRELRVKWASFARSNPLSRMDMHSDDVMAELQELFPNSASGVTTSL